jgi:hypothetical protein
MAGAVLMAMHGAKPGPLSGSFERPLSPVDPSGLQSGGFEKGRRCSLGNGARGQDVRVRT